MKALIASIIILFCLVGIIILKLFERELDMFITRHEALTAWILLSVGVVGCIILARKHTWS